MFATQADSLWNNSWWYDPVILGRYPEDGLRHFEKMLPTGWEKDLDAMHQPLDFLGTNIYNGERIRAGAQNASEAVPYPAGAPISAFKWTVTPDALYWGPRLLNERYQLPIVITENGMSNADWVHEDGTVPDPQRIEFTRTYLRALRRAVQDGVNVMGYFHWSLMDNFEWAEGYKERFGLIHVDYSTGKRTPKASYYWYRDLIARGGAGL
jgi:beta-glucosidase